MISRVTKKKGRPKENDLGRNNPLMEFAEDYLTKNGFKVNKAQKEAYRRTILNHLKEIAELTLNPRGVLLPSRLGHLRVIGYMSDLAIVDQHTSKKLGKTIYYNNAHTDGYTFKIKLSPAYDILKKKVSGFKFDSLWLFRPNRIIRKRLVTCLKDKTVDFRTYAIYNTI